MVKALPAGHTMEHVQLTNILIITVVVSAITVSAALGQEPVKEACPAPCICYTTNHTSHVTCANQSLSSIPNDLPDNVTWLDLSGNVISSLDSDVFHVFTKVQKLDLSFNRLSTINATYFNTKSFNSLQNLDLSHNHISNIADQAFKNMPNLQVLNISHNSLSSLDGAIVSGLLDIQLLDLSHNVISMISSDAFLHTDQLEVLDLSSNSISDIPKALFNNINSLTVLNLGNNKLERFHDAAMFSESSTLLDLDLSYNDLSNISIHVLSGLESLNIGWNNIHQINTTLFKQLANLTTLTMDGNPVSSIITPVFEHLKSLRELSLSNMPNLTYLSHVTFDGLDSIEILVIRNNRKLSFIHRNLFSSLANIISVDLSFNDIVTLHNGTFDLDSGNISSIDIQGNRFVCDCAIDWLVEEIQGNSSIFQDQDQLECHSKSFNHTSSLLTYSIELLHCSDVTITNHSSDRAFQIGSSVLLKCEAYSDPNPEIVWITPRQRVFSYHDYYHTPIEYMTIEEILATLPSSPASDESPSYSSQSESRPDRIRILRDGSLYIDFIMRGDAGPYTCVARNPQNSTEVVINVSLDYLVLLDVQIWSLIIGFSSAGAFFLLNLIYSLTLAAIRRCISQRRRERIRHMIETIDHYKTSQLSRIKDNYNNQVGKIRDQYHYQLGRLREHHSSQMSRMGRMREGASLKVDRLKENYNNQLGRLKDYSSSQLVQLREKYNCQVDRIKDYGNDKLDRLHERYKMKQQHVIKLFDMMNLDKCRTAFESECVRTESMILQSDVFTNEVPIHSPIDSVSVSDSEYMTATSTESSKYSSQRNIHHSNDDASDMTPMNPYMPEDCTTIDMDTGLEDVELELQGATYAPMSKVEKRTSKNLDFSLDLEAGNSSNREPVTPDFSLDLDAKLSELEFEARKDIEEIPEPSHLISVPFPPGRRPLSNRQQHRPRHKRSAQSRQKQYSAEGPNVEEMEELYTVPCDTKNPKRDKNGRKKPNNDQIMLTDSNSCSSKSIDDSRCTKLPTSKKFTSKDRPLSITKAKSDKKSKSDPHAKDSKPLVHKGSEPFYKDGKQNTSGLRQEPSMSAPLDVIVQPATSSKRLSCGISDIEDIDAVPQDGIGESVV